jgi:hypothetical protein
MKQYVLMLEKKEWTLPERRRNTDLKPLAGQTAMAVTTVEPKDLLI